jgi:hypothetical protein
MSEITGSSGQRSLDAILAGERDPIKLAELCHARVKSSQDILARALEGDYRSEHLFDAANGRLVVVRADRFRFVADRLPSTPHAFAANCVRPHYCE